MLSTEPFLSAPPSSTNELITQGPPLPSETPDPAPIFQALTNELEMSQAPPTDVEALVNELTGEGLPPDLPGVQDQLTGGETVSIGSQTSQEAPPTSSETSLNESITQGVPPEIRPSPPSLHANEELLSDDSDEAVMETAPQSGGSLAPPPAPPNATGSRSDSGQFSHFVE